MRQVDLIFANDTVTQDLALFVFQFDPGTEETLSRSAGGRSTTGLLNALAKKPETTINLSQALFTVNIFSVLGAVSELSCVRDLGYLRAFAAP